MINDVTIVFDNYNHPNQPLWNNWFNNIIKSDLDVNAYARHFHGLRNDVKPIKNDIRSGLGASIVKGRLNISRRDFKYYRFANNLGRVVHFMNAQMYPELSRFLQDKVKKGFTFRGYDLLVRPKIDSVWEQQLINIFKTGDFFHFVSKDLRNEAIIYGAEPMKCHVIHQGVGADFCIEQEKKITNNEVSILSIGRLTWQKGYYFALEALRLIKRNGGKFKYIIAGELESKELEMLSYHIKRLELERDVSFVGHADRSRLKELLINADVFLMPSLTEGIPNALLEALAMGVPSIASAVGGIPEIIISKDVGLLFDACNVEQMAECLKRLMENKELRASISQNGIQIIQNEFNPEFEFREWVELFNSQLIRK
jgi:colanic acid/amylovoran biosynthesis glycosyltransferase